MVSARAPEAVTDVSERIYCGADFKPKRQSLPTVKPVNALMIIAPALPFQQDVHPAVTMVNTSLGDFPDAQAQRTVVSRSGALPARAAADL